MTFVLRGHWDDNLLSNKHHQILLAPDTPASSLVWGPNIYRKVSVCQGVAIPLLSERAPPLRRRSFATRSARNHRGCTRNLRPLGRGGCQRPQIPPSTSSAFSRLPTIFRMAAQEASARSATDTGACACSQPCPPHYPQSSPLGSHLGSSAPTFCGCWSLNGLR